MLISLFPANVITFVLFRVITAMHRSHLESGEEDARPTRQRWPPVRYREQDSSRASISPPPPPPLRLRRTVWCLFRTIGTSLGRLATINLGPLYGVATLRLTINRPFLAIEACCKYRLTSRTLVNFFDGLVPCKR